MVLWCAHGGVVFCDGTTLVSLRPKASISRSPCSGLARVLSWVALVPCDVRYDRGTAGEATPGPDALACCAQGLWHSTRTCICYVSPQPSAQVRALIGPAQSPCLPDLQSTFGEEIRMAVQSMLVCGLGSVAVVYLRKSLLHHVHHRPELLFFAVIALPFKAADLRLDFGLPAKVFESPAAPSVRRDLQRYFAHARTGAAHDLKRLAWLLVRLGQAALVALGGREGALAGNSNLVRGRTRCSSYSFEHCRYSPYAFCSPTWTRCTGMPCGCWMSKPSCR